jgi:hypothetical protein
MCLPFTQAAAAIISTSLHSPRMAANRGMASLLAANAASLVYLHNVGCTIGLFACSGSSWAYSGSQVKGRNDTRRDRTNVCKAAKQRVKSRSS